MSDAIVLSAAAARIRLRDRLAARLVLGQMARWRSGCVLLVLPDGSSLRLGDPSSSRQVRVTVKDWRFFRRALAAGDIGAGESYMDGEWWATDLVELCRLFLADPSVLDYRSPWTVADRLRSWLIRISQTNTVRRSRRNIRHHYDLSNDFFRLFLDESMTYSCAFFSDPEVGLEEAQRAKIDRICRRLELGPGMRVLEIGSGWGALAIHAAQEYGCRVTSLTVSEGQLRLARERAAEAGVGSSVDIRLCDYRAACGQFDRIVSVEMLEAVGYEYYGTFFRKCAELLSPGGRMLLQTITVPDHRFDRYRRELDWIRKYIFPGGLLPSVFEIARAVKENTRLQIHWMEDIGPHYAATLRCWRERYLRRLPEVRGLGFDDRFIRMWEFYLSSCEAAFSVGYVGDLQIELRS
jgi:cyclopropane-fatty-acyl-phospholipid synthase